LNDDIKLHLCNEGFMLNYLVWRDHREVQPTVESDGNVDEDQMDEMIADIGRKYYLDYEASPPPLEVQKSYRLLAASDEKVYEGTDVIILLAVTRLIVMISKYNFSNQFYNDIVQPIIDLISAKHIMSKDLYQSKKILAVLV
jgi:hypothetical protein